VKPWTPTVRRYPHFHPVISVDEAAAIATNPTQVAKHTFYPFLKYNVSGFWLKVKFKDFDCAFSFWIFNPLLCLDLYDLQLFFYFCLAFCLSFVS
jgi:hypothetical protein